MDKHTSSWQYCFEVVGQIIELYKIYVGVIIIIIIIIIIIPIIIVIIIIINMSLWQPS